MKRIKKRIKKNKLALTEKNFPKLSEKRSITHEVGFPKLKNTKRIKFP